MFYSLRHPGVMAVTLSAAGILTVTMGIRQTFGLFISPINASTGMSIATISLAMAIGQFTWGAIQPVAGAVADRYGPQRVLAAGLLILALGCAVAPFMTEGFGLTVALGLLASIGSGIGSFSVLIGAAAARLPEESRGTASGVINAGGSFGQFVFAPVVQKLIQAVGWMGALWAMALVALASLPLISRLVKSGGAPPAPVAGEQRLGEAVRAASRDRSYWLLHLGFFTCGFHIAFLVTHLPGEVDLCGLPPSVASWSLAIIGLANIVGSIYAGNCVSKYRSKYILAVMYGSRAVLIAWYLMMPRTEWVFYIFAAGLGFTWLATVPPTAAIVGKLFGTRYLATLFGLTLFSHQLGGFLGAWLGGLAITHFGDFMWMWYADMALAIIAALVNLPIKEGPVVRHRSVTLNT
ncbi:MAG TPA: MFS transporter [Pusillimonas sp.]|jgi:predicted MFS family arabinose efflux permease|nr:MFS transporter [Pusillimonas sp.]MBC41007.1 MFS transporter [Pusillimonas sp.]HBT31431.1 MFS transporter [Pusillimonas sp.]HCN70502.1 MFS transporter [Pusillimonas sp.]HCP77487.1 MFS transporter [Pusillimonas sp.]|tara:strand:+ start:110769 stop:111992 length:1224 start_codon:yes stop_codon:yes gene_type:complete